MKKINVDRLAGEILKLDREVEGLATAGRVLMGQQAACVRAPDTDPGKK
jgi:hypothetical protein